MAKENLNIVIAGAGISGLATAHLLEKEGYRVTVIEAADKPGGAMQSVTEKDFLVDYGPNSGLETTPLISETASETGMRDEMIYANDEGNIRYILRNGELHPLPMAALTFIKSKLFSVAGKLRLFKEPFTGKAKNGDTESMADFVTRRLGREFYDYAIDPFVSGVFAGDPEKLAVKYAFPKLYRLEELYGGLVQGLVKGAKERRQRAEKGKNSAKMFSFLYGMQSFPEAIAKSLKSEILYNTKVNKVTKNENGYNIEIVKDGESSVINSDIYISTVPAYITGKILGNLDGTLKNHLDEIFYPPVIVIYAGYKKEDVKRPLDGFGYLIPSKEKQPFLGAIWSSTIFINRAPDKHASFTIFVGGARNQEIMKEDVSAVVDRAMKGFEKVTNVEGKPVLLKYKLWEKAIPQYNVGYHKHLEYFEKFEKENQGIFLSGNYRGGISVGDCFKSAEITKNRVLGYIKSK